MKLILKRREKYILSLILMNKLQVYLIMLTGSIIFWIIVIFIFIFCHYLTFPPLLNIGFLNPGLAAGLLPAIGLAGPLAPGLAPGIGLA